MKVLQKHSTRQHLLFPKSKTFFSHLGTFSHFSAHAHPAKPERLLLKSKISLILEKKPLKLQSTYLYLLQEFEAQKEI